MRSFSKIRPIVFTMLFLTLAATNKSQTSNTTKNSNKEPAATTQFAKLNSQKTTLTVSYTSSQETNLLVIITDPKGETVFLENKYRFKGDYLKDIVLKDYRPGKYEVKIITDQERLTNEILLNN